MKTRAALWAAIVCVCPTWATAVRAAEPKAYLYAPSTAEANQLFKLRFTGTVSDKDITLVQVSGPPGEPDLLYGKDGRPQFGLVQATAEGTYGYALVAVGTPPGATESTYALAFATVQVGSAPNPGPNPPNPGPAPDPNTTPGSKIGAAYVVMFALANAQAWTAYADAMQAGKTIAESQASFKAAWDGTHRPWVDKYVGPAVTAIVAEGQQPTADQRTALIKLARDIAAGSKISARGGR